MAHYLMGEDDLSEDVPEGDPAIFTLGAASGDNDRAAVSVCRCL